MDNNEIKKYSELLLNKPGVLSILGTDNSNGNLIDRFEVDIKDIDVLGYDFGANFRNKKYKVLFQINMYLNTDKEFIDCDGLWHKYNLDTSWWEHHIIPNKLSPIINFIDTDETILTLRVFSKDGNHQYCLENVEEINEGITDTFKFESRKPTFSHQDITGLTEDVMKDMSIEELETVSEALMYYVRQFSYDWDDNGNRYVRYDEDRNPVEYLSRDEHRTIQEIRNNLYNIKNNKEKELSEKEGNELIPIFLKFLEMDKKINPKNYPEWLELNVNETTNWGELMVSPIIDVDKWLSQGGSSREIRETKYRIEHIWNQYVKSKRKLSVQQVYWSGLDSYIKKVFRKEIRPKFKELPGGDCLHSVIFRARNSWNNVDIQIYPRIKSDCRDWYSPRKFSEYQLQEQIRDILKEYGWVHGKNYTFSGDRD